MRGKTVPISSTVRKGYRKAHILKPKSREYVW
jgi:hypothetical protein